MYKYYSSPQTNEELIESLIKNEVLITPKIEKALREIDRINFVPKDQMRNAYLDIPVEIGMGQTVSQPYTIAFMLELLNVRAKDEILDLGSGSCWSTIILANLTGAKGHVYGVEIKPKLFKIGNKNIKKFSNKNITNLMGKKGVLGIPGQKFDKILVSASCGEIPQALVDQLKQSGRMVIPVKNAILKVDKISKKDIQVEDYQGFSFVPLLT